MPVCICRGSDGDEPSHDAAAFGISDNTNRSFDPGGLLSGDLYVALHDDGGREYKPHGRTRFQFPLLNNCACRAWKERDQIRIMLVFCSFFTAAGKDGPAEVHSPFGCSSP